MTGFRVFCETHLLSRAKQGMVHSRIEKPLFEKLNQNPLSDASVMKTLLIIYKISIKCLSLTRAESGSNYRPLTTVIITDTFPSSSSPVFLHYLLYSNLVNIISTVILAPTALKRFHLLT